MDGGAMSATPPVLPPREANLDGMLHTEDGQCCRCERPCPRCGGRLHLQGIYGGMMEVCETCPVDADQWSPAGTFVTDGVTVDGSGSLIIGVGGWGEDVPR